MMHHGRPLALLLALSLTPAVNAEDARPQIVTQFLNAQISVATSAQGRPTSVPSSTIPLPARIVTIDARKVAEIVDRDGRSWWVPRRQLVADVPKAGGTSPCTGDRTRGVRGVKC